MAEPRHDEAGFLLVEALVALAIIAVMSTLVFTTVVQSAHTAATINQRREAMLLARSVLAAATIDSATNAIPEHGSDGAFDWQITTQSHSGEGGLQLSDVSVRIIDRASGRDLARLDGLKAQR